MTYAKTEGAKINTFILVEAAILNMAIDSVVFDLDSNDNAI